MSTLNGRTIANTYKDLLHIENNNLGLDGSTRAIQDGSGQSSKLKISQSTVNVSGTFQINGQTLTATVSALNNITDLTAVTGMVAVSGTNVYGRTLTGGTGVSITNADGTEGNPTIALNPSGATSGTYGPVSNITVNSVGQITDITVPASISVAEVKGSTFTTEYLNASANVSITGSTHIVGPLTVDGILSATGIVATSLTFNGDINVGGASFTAKISGTAAEFSGTVSAAAFVGDGSGLVNVPSSEGGTVKFITAGTGVSITVDGATSTSIPVSGTLSLNANQSFGIVSATNIDTDELLIAGVSAATVNEVAAVSALTQTNLDAITSINAVVANVSALTSVNTAAITSINAVVANVSALVSTNSAAITSINAAYTSVSAALEARVATVSALTSVNLAAITSINIVVANVSALTSTNAAAITSINSVITALSATVATSIDTANTRITSVSDYAVALSATMATSIATANTRITSVSDYAVALSATMATSIATANTRITSVSDYAVALSATLATSIANYLPLAGGTITGTVSAQEVDVSSIGIGTVAGAKRLTMSGAAVAQYASLTDGTSIAVDFNTAQNFIVQLAGNRTLESPTNCVAGQTGSIIIVQDGTGGRTLAYGANWKFAGGTAPTLSTGVSAVDRLDYIVYTSLAVQAIATLDIK